MYTYPLAFRLLEIGKASALGVLTLLFVSVLIGGIIFMLYRRERGRSDGGRAAARRSCCSWRSALYTAFNLVPIIWAVLDLDQAAGRRLRDPADKLIFKPTFEYHYEVWVEKEFWMLSWSTAWSSPGAVVLISVPIGTMAAYALSRSRTPAHPLDPVRAARPSGCSRTSCWRSRSSSWAAI